MTTRTRCRTPRALTDRSRAPSPGLRRAPTTLGVLVLSGLLLPACASSGGAFEDGGQLSNVQVTVENNNWSDITVYALLAGGTRDRLGFLTTSRTETFRINTERMGSDPRVFLVADAVGSSEVFRTEPLHVQSGDHIYWRIQEADEGSTVQIVSGGGGGPDVAPRPHRRGGKR